MVLEKLDPGETEPTLRDLARELRRAQVAWAEAFLFYKTQDLKRTDGVAKAMADLDVDLVTPTNEYLRAKLIIMMAISSEVEDA